MAMMPADDADESDDAYKKYSLKLIISLLIILNRIQDACFDRNGMEKYKLGVGIADDPESVQVQGK